MNFLSREGVRLAYKEDGSKLGLPSVVLVHGWGGDHTLFELQRQYLSSLTRVVTLDLRGHGKSDAPGQKYTMAGYAEDVAFLIQELRLERPLLAGHSMGGNLGLECAARFPHLLGSLLMIDSVLFPSLEVVANVKPLLEVLAGPNWKQACLAGLSHFNLETDAGEVFETQFAAMPHASQPVLLSSLTDQVLNHDAQAAARLCKIPVAYIGSSNCQTDLALFRQLTPQLMTSQVLGSGHFSPLVVPDQISFMIARFLQLANRNNIPHTGGNYVAPHK